MKMEKRIVKEFLEYQNLINKIAEYAFKKDIKLQVDYISKILELGDSNIKNDINQAIYLRRALGIIEQEVSNFHSVINAGSRLYANFEDIDAAFCVSYDISCIVNRYNLKKECENYNNSDEIFDYCPNLLHLTSNNNELINISSMKNSKFSRILDYDERKIKISNRLNPMLIDYLKTKYPKNTLWARIDKNNYGEKIWEYVTEAVIRSEKSGWYKNMRIFNGENRKGSYSYPETFIRLGFSKEEADKLIKNGYKENGEISLQTFFKRDNNGLLSGSIEELTPITYDRVLITRYLHLTSTSSIGEKWEEANLAHIDGAINIYFDGYACSRLTKHLDEKVKTECRTHLFKIENIPITELLPISKLFFQGLALVEEWEQDSIQFS